MDVAGAERAIVSLCILLMQDLQVQCEAQVLLFVLDYIDGTQVEPAGAAQLFQHVSSLSYMLIPQGYGPANPPGCTPHVLLTTLCTADWLLYLFLQIQQLALSGCYNCLQQSSCSVPP